MPVVGPLGPWRCIAEVNLQDDIGGMPSVAVRPLAHRMDQRLAAQRDTDSYLQGPQGGLRILLVRLAQTLADKTSQALPDSDGPNIVCPLRNGMESGTSEVGRKLGGGRRRTTSVRWAATSSQCGVLRASRRCSFRRPVGPAALPRLKPLAAVSTCWTDKSGTWLRAGGPSGTSPGLAGGHEGCLARSWSSTPPSSASSGGLSKAARPRELALTSKRQAARLAGGVGGFAVCRVARAGSGRASFPELTTLALKPASTPTQGLLAASSRRLDPPRRGERRMALGNISRSRQAVKVKRTTKVDL